MFLKHKFMLVEEERRRCQIINGIDDLIKEAKLMLGKVLVTQTGPEGKKVKRLYIEEASDISKEFYLSCLIDRATSKIAFISSTEGGMDIEKGFPKHLIK